MDKDTLMKVRSTIRGKNSKGGDRVQLYLDGETVTALIESLTALASSPKGVKIDLHTNKRESEDGRQFDSSFFFVKAVGEGRAGPGAPRTGAVTRFKPKAPIA